MKELSIEEKAKAYDEAINVAEKYHNGTLKDVMETIFPGLMESEDERIRKDVISFVEQAINAGYGIISKERKEKWIAWLEKQGEHANFRNKIQIGDKVTRNEDGVLVNLSQLKRVAKKDEKQGEQKPYASETMNEKGDFDNGFTRMMEKEQKPADKVEHKFEIGDWVVYDHRPYQVVELPKEGYINLGLRGNGKIEFAPSTYCRHWTIQDAKDGDVLATEGFVFIFKEIREDKGIGYFCANENELHEGDDSTFHIANPNSLMGSINNDFTHYTPATKEQRDLLFAKMKEAGYEWDDTKKKLRKIEQESAAWSEEDELHIKELESLVKKVWATAEHENDKDTIHKMSDLSFFLKTLKPQHKQKWSEEDENMLKLVIKSCEQCGNEYAYYWLKSIKPQNRWKPSELQLECLDDAIKHYQSNGSRPVILVELLKDLKKLKEGKL